MRLFSRAGAPPADVVARAGLRRGERVLAAATTADGWVLGTVRHLVLLTPDEVRTIPWERVEDAAWDAESSTLRVSEVGEYAAPRPSYDLVLGDPDLLLQLVRERVTASIVLQRRVPVRGRRGLVVIGRRSPVGGPISWMHAYDAGVDPEDPEVVVVADLALAQARAEVGEEPVSPI